MAENDIYNSKKRYESIKEHLEELTKPTETNGELIITSLANFVYKLLFYGGGILLWFVIGAVIGLIVRKIKQESQLR